MKTIGLILLLGMSPTQEGDLERRIDAFLKGDEKARKELLDQGPRVIRPLLKVRERDPDRVGALIFYLKKAASLPRDSAAIKALNLKITLTVEDGGFGSATVSGLREAGVPVFLAWIDPATTKVGPMHFEDVTARVVLDYLCSQSGLDYGFFHNSVVIGPPERLWPGDRPVKPENAWGSFHPAGIEGQKLGKDDEALLKRLKETKLDLAFTDAPLSEVTGWIEGLTGIPLGIRKEDQEKPVTIHAKAQSVYDVLALVTQSLDLDFAVVKRGIQIDIKENVSKIVGNGKK
jgi:hypothetical protein